MKYWKRITESARGELFNPLLWPFLLATLAYGIGFSIFINSGIGTQSSTLFMAMAAIHPIAPFIWGLIAMFTILGGLTFLLFNIPPWGKISGVVGFMLWLFASVCYGFYGNWLLVFALTVPNMWFWIWQYISLSRFREEERIDAQNLRLDKAQGRVL
jgi:cellulose synthase/poly-beta-1,6-N-acetylglucosamine synthase-like glycosyltransferase